MPFKVRFDIYDFKHKAPIYTTHDRTLARVEYNHLSSKGLHRMISTVTPYDMNQQEAYLYHVYKVREAQKKYWRDGKQKDDLQTSLALESELDKWNAETRQRLNAIQQTGSIYTPADTGAFQFFLQVEEWRKRWKEYFGAKKRNDHEASAKLYTTCRDLEAKIDIYIKQKIGL